MKLSKWTVEIIIAVTLLVVGLGIWWFIATKDERAAKAELETMIKYAQRQALEIAIIEQSSKLANYRQQLTANKQQSVTHTQPAMPSMPMPVKPDEQEGQNE